jgi:hypothetical protein
MAARQTSLHLSMAEGWRSPGDTGTLPMPAATQRILPFTCTKDSSKDHMTTSWIHTPV